MVETHTDLDEQLRRIVSDRHAPGIAIAAICGLENSCVYSGYRTVSTGQAIEKDTLFELGSLSKTFTGLLLADMVHRGEVTYDDPISAYLPKAYIPAHPLAAAITLRHLATHTGGLPRLPINLYLQAIQNWRTNPYARYTQLNLYRATSRIKPRTVPGSVVRYSNFGVALLGQLLANAIQRDFTSLVMERICRPLGMTATSASLTAESLSRCATGYRHNKAVPPLCIGAFAGAGAVRSTPYDMQIFVQAQLKPRTTAMEVAVNATHRPHATMPNGDRVCLIWNDRTIRGGHRLLFHSGGTPGFTSFVGFSPTAQTGIVALANVSPTRRATFIDSAYRLLRKMTQRITL